MMTPESVLWKRFSFQNYCGLIFRYLRYCRPIFIVYVTIIQVENSDNRNYWCQVSVENSTDNELEFDMKSVVLRLYDSGATPKFHSVDVDDDIVATHGGNATIDCA